MIRSRRLYTRVRLLCFRIATPALYRIFKIYALMGLGFGSLLHAQVPLGEARDDTGKRAYSDRASQDKFERERLERSANSEQFNKRLEEEQTENLKQGYGMGQKQRSKVKTSDPSSVKHKPLPPEYRREKEEDPPELEPGPEMQKLKGSQPTKIPTH